METIYAIIITIIGCIFASFFGVIISRVPKGLSIVKPASHCDSCGHELAWYENIPILSYLFLGGKCKKCKARIPLTSLFYEMLGGAVLLLTYLKVGLSIDLAFMAVITLLLLLIAGYDYRTNTILDVFWIILLVIVIGYDVYRVVALEESVWPYLIGCGISLAFFGLVKLIFYFLLKVDALGTGDIIFMGIAGLLLGYKTILFAILIASVFGSIIELTLISLKKRNKEDPIPFLPYLTLGVYITALYGLDLFNLLMGV